MFCALEISLLSEVEQLPILRDVAVHLPLIPCGPASGLHMECCSGVLLCKVPILHGHCVLTGAFSLKTVTLTNSAL